MVVRVRSRALPTEDARTRMARGAARAQNGEVATDLVYALRALEGVGRV